MIEGRRVLVVVPARGGSKGIKLKNLRTVAGRPMVALVGDVVSKVAEVDRAVVSTDHDEIAAVAEAAGLSAPFRRPTCLSGDRIGDFEVLEHALLACEALDERIYDIVVMLQPTSPLRTAANVADTLRMLVAGGWDSVVTVSETDLKAHPLKQFVLDGEQLRFFDEKGRGVVARQELTPLYHRNGIAYAMTRDCLLQQKTIFGSKAGALVVPGHHVSIDTEWDLKLVEFLLSARNAD
jgi:CMP-N,N'-diacetyllegionaminic acid synthase